ncbi:flagellar basal body-associated FliL family protein [Mesorhizobium sp. AaZ16]|uniref:flagellar basal body-associated FliL family protein n=1 Tax=Mesorhizobium sp. AaZ16 TaxID=3402289 RepID=UPI00374E7085
MAITDQAPTPPKGPSLLVQMAVLLGMTAAAIVLGWASGIYLNGSSEPAEPVAHATEAHGEAAPEGAEGARTVVPLASITTNLAAPEQVWIRLEASVVLDEPQPQELIETIHQDLLAYLRTVKLHQVEGASGFQHLKADLEERAKIRSDGHVKQFLIRTLLFE